MIDSNGNSRDSSGIGVNNSGAGSIHLSSNREKEYLVSCTSEIIQPKYVFCN
jgi:hypothetical protein